jgi:hypothetical protein
VLKTGAALLITVLTMIMPRVAGAQTFNTSATGTFRADEPALRGFDPGLITGHGPTDPWPDTSAPQPNIPLPEETGSSAKQFTQEVIGSVAGLTLLQSSTNQIDSGVGNFSARAHHIETSFSQSESEQGQLFEMAFSIDAMTDADGKPASVLTGAGGNPVSATGTFTQTVRDPVTTGGATLSCSGTFTFDPTNGYVLESGPAGQCP